MYMYRIKPYTAGRSERPTILVTGLAQKNVSDKPKDIREYW